MRAAERRRDFRTQFARLDKWHLGGAFHSRPTGHVLAELLLPGARPGYALKIIVAPYETCPFSIDQVSLGNPGAAQHLLVVTGKRPTGMTDWDAKTLSGRATHAGAELGWTFGGELALDSNFWSGTFAVTDYRDKAYTIHASIPANEKHIRVAREFRYVVGPPRPAREG